MTGAATLFDTYFTNNTIFHLYSNSGNVNELDLRDLESSDYNNKGYRFTNFNVADCEYTKEADIASITLPAGMYIAIQMQTSSSYYYDDMKISGSGLTSYGLNSFTRVVDSSSERNFVFSISKETSVTIGCPSKYIDYVGYVSYYPQYKIKKIA